MAPRLPHHALCSLSLGRRLHVPALLDLTGSYLESVLAHLDEDMEPWI